nr:NADH dehydrogenase subunit 6 [Microperla geei]
MMNTILFTISAIMSLTFTQMTHPLAMGLMLLVQTLIICLITGMTTKSFWFAYILFLVFLGGLLVLFIYVTSLASNEMFTFSSTNFIASTIILLLTLSIWMFLDPLPWMISMFNNDMEVITQMLTHQEEASQSLISLYSQPTSTVTLTLVLYLFLTLIAIVKITSIFHGPLRQK